MSLKNILVAFNGSDSSVDALRYAASLASDGAHVTALLAHSLQDTVDSHAAWVPETARRIIAEAKAEIVKQVETRFSELAQALGLGERLHFLRRSGRVDTVLSETARGYDIIVAGQGRAEKVDDRVSIHPDRIALLSGCPVLIVPRGHDATAQRNRAVLAWDGGRAAARALSDGLDLLAGQGRATVLTMGEIRLPCPAQDVLTHLERHGVDARHEVIPAEPGPARALLAYCRKHEPSLLVMGAYEHSKFREDFLGGVTARVLRDTPVPVLLSH